MTDLAETLAHLRARVNWAIEQSARRAVAHPDLGRVCWLLEEARRRVVEAEEVLAAANMGEEEDGDDNGV